MLFIPFLSKIDVLFQQDEGRITRSSRTYTKEGKTRGFQADPFARSKPTAQELYEDYQKFVGLEKECGNKLKETDREFEDILERREDEEANIQLKYSVYDVSKESRGNISKSHS
jgi:hypothetical protein